jgi:hypothetical protein
MVNVGETKPYLTAWELKDGEILTIKDGGAIQEFKSPDGRTRKRIIIGIKEYDKPIVLNNTSVNALASAYGADTKDWVGKKAKVHIQDLIVAGRQVKTVFLLPAVK